VSTRYDYCSIAIFRSLTRSQLRHTSSGERYSLLLTVTKSTHHCKDESLLVCCPVMPLCAVVRFIWNDLIQNSVRDTRETENCRCTVSYIKRCASLPFRYVFIQWCSSGNRLLAAVQCIVIGPVCLLFASGWAVLVGGVWVGMFPRELEIVCIDPHQTGFVWKGSDDLQLIKCRPSRALVILEVWT